ncbi:Hypothetical_protein [Hexamita inflata]|uniref:Hypothetical_protein n=1 Tax=Hexamita inflata TaxID=28002 RepID=A0AA86TT84_9EUKA|nr:Hypothetical protein HINF_LOCUS15150 [Hexamita inflata]
MSRKLQVTILPPVPQKAVTNKIQPLQDSTQSIGVVLQTSYCETSRFNIASYQPNQLIQQGAINDSSIDGFAKVLKYQNIGKDLQEQKTQVQQLAKQFEKIEKTYVKVMNNISIMSQNQDSIIQFITYKK